MYSSSGLTLFAVYVLDQDIVECVLSLESSTEINWNSWCVLPLQLIACRVRWGEDREREKVKSVY